MSLDELNAIYLNDRELTLLYNGFKKNDYCPVCLQQTDMPENFKNYKIMVYEYKNFIKNNKIIEFLKKYISNKETPKIIKDKLLFFSNNKANDNELIFNLDWIPSMEEFEKEAKNKIISIEIIKKIHEKNDNWKILLKDNKRRMRPTIEKKFKEMCEIFDINYLFEFKDDRIILKSEDKLDFEFMSESEKKRISLSFSIAYATSLKSTKIIIFDDPIDSYDTLNIFSFSEIINNKLKGFSKIILTHNLDLIINASKENSSNIIKENEKKPVFRMKNKNEEISFVKVSSEIDVENQFRDFLNKKGVTKIDTEILMIFSLFNRYIAKKQVIYKQNFSKAIKQILFSDLSSIKKCPNVKISELKYIKIKKSNWIEIFKEYYYNINNSWKQPINNNTTCLKMLENLCIYVKNSNNKKSLIKAFGIDDIEIVYNFVKSWYIRALQESTGYHFNLLEKAKIFSLSHIKENKLFSLLFIDISVLLDIESKINNFSKSKKI